MKFSIGIIGSLACILLLTSCEVIAVKAVLLEIAKKFALNVASDVTIEYLKPSHLSQEVLAKNQQQLAELNRQMNELQKQSAESLQIVMQLADTLNQMQQEMPQKFEQRQINMERHFSSIRQAQRQLETADDKKPLQFPITYQFRSAQDKTGQFQPLNNQVVLHSRDSYKVIFTPNEKLYVYIFQKDASDKVQRLFPMDEFKGTKLNNINPVEQGKQYILPAKEKSFRLDEVAGTEKIYFIVSRYKDVILENLPQTLNSPKTEQAILAMFEQSKGYSDIVDDEKMSSLQWREGGQTMFAKINTILQSCNGCVNILTFEHR